MMMTMMMSRLYIVICQLTVLWR